MPNCGIIKNKTGDISDKNNYRPISLATIVAKVLDSVLDSYLEKHIKSHDAQFGFKPGLSTESAILSLKHTVRYYTDRMTPIYACFLDLSKAFDLVSYDILWRKLREQGVPSEMSHLLQYWYANQVNSVRWVNTFSEEYRLECGVRQGGLTSPRLFNLYIDELIVGLSNMRVGCWVDGVCINSISYADDMVLLAPTVRALRSMLNLCESYAKYHGLVYNVKKSEYMVFKAAGKCPSEVPELLLNGVNLKRVFKFKYLGHYIADDLKDHVDIERERRALAVRCNMLARRFARCTDQVKITLFKAYCQGFVLRVQYNNGFRALLGLPRYCSASEMFAQSHTDGFFAVLRKKTASLLNRIRTSSNSILKTVAEKYDSPIINHFVQLLTRQAK
ncbi:hypothetical protein ABMA28_002818 [Loxostege sticticalis]|uniref:Reverse transcriptase domain-containing protein n=1 Tax=Loxostege sticticalis TaxID=481309 RepID=A0ABD0SZC3_LOXSC